MLAGFGKPMSEEFTAMIMDGVPPTMEVAEAMGVSSKKAETIIGRDSEIPTNGLKMLKVLRV